MKEIKGKRTRVLHFTKGGGRDSRGKSIIGGWNVLITKKKALGGIGSE